MWQIWLAIFLRKMSKKKYQINSFYRYKVGNVYLERKYILKKHNLYNVSKKFNKVNRLNLSLFRLFDVLIV